MDISKVSRGALLAVFLGGLGIGFAPVLVRLSEVGPSATAFYRLLFALPFLWLLIFRDWTQGREAVSPNTAKDFLLLAVAGLLFTADLAIWHWSLQYTSVANSTLLANTAPIFVTIGARLFFREKITTAFVVGMVVAFLGAASLLSGRIDFGPNHWLGDLLALVAACFYGGYLLMVKQLRERFSSPTIMAWSGLVSCVALLVVAVASRERILPPDLRGWLVLATLGLVSHLGGQTLIAYALGHLPASFSSISLLLQPFIAAILAWVVLKERLTPWQWTGGMVILGGIFLASGSWQGRKPAAEPKIV